MQITDPAALDILRRAKVARIATLSANGRPSVTSIYFAVVNGHIWLGTADWTLAAREAAADPRVSVLLQNERDPQDRRILRITGNAVVRLDGAAQRVFMIQAALRYSWTPGGLLNQWKHRHLLGMMRRYHAQSADKGKPCVIDVTPERVEILEAP